MDNTVILNNLNEIKFLIDDLIKKFSNNKTRTINKILEDNKIKKLDYLSENQIIKPIDTKIIESLIDNDNDNNNNNNNNDDIQPNDDEIPDIKLNNYQKRLLTMTSQQKIEYYKNKNLKNKMYRANKKIN